MPNTTTEVSDLSFYWWYTSFDDTPLALQSCSVFTFAVGANPNATVQPVPPYTMLVYPADGIPQSLAAGDGSDPIKWKLTYAIGTQIIITFVDSNGLSGGTSPITTVTSNSGGSKCSPPTQNSDLSFDYSLDNPLTCEATQFSINGGTPPYTLSIQKAADQTINITNISTNASWTNSLEAGGAIMYSVSDSAGNYAICSDVIFSQGGTNTSCLMSGDPTNAGTKPSGIQQEDPPHKGANKGLVAGISVASILCLALMATIGFLLWKKRSPSSKRLSFTCSSPSTGINEFQGLQSAIEKSNSPFNASRPFDEASVHSLQNLHPFKFRVVNPDLDQDRRNSIDSILESSPTESNPFSSPPKLNKAWPDNSAQASGYTHSRTGSGGISTIASRRRSGSLKSGSEKRRSDSSKLSPKYLASDSSEEEFERVGKHKSISTSSSATLDDYGG